MLNYIEKYSKRPEFIELVLFYYNRLIEAGKKTTLPFLTEIWSQELAEKFIKASEDKSVQEILALVEKSRPIETRIKMEA